MDQGNQPRGYNNGHDRHSSSQGSSNRTPSPPTLPQVDEFTLFTNAALLGLKQRGIDVMTTPTDDGWGMSAIKGKRLIEVAVADTPEATARDLFLRLMFKSLG